MAFVEIDPSTIKLDSNQVSPTMVIPPSGGLPPPNGGKFVEVDPSSIQLDEPKPEGTLAQRFAKGAFEGIGQAGLGVMQAATELVAPTGGVNALTGDLKGTKKLLTDTVDSSRQRAEKLGTAGKVGEVTGMVAGSVPFIAAGGMQAAPEAATSVGSRILGQTALGAEQGAMQPVGSGDSRLQNSIMGAATGGLLSGATEVAKPVVGVAGKALEVGKNATFGKSQEDLLKDIITKTGKTPEELQAALEQGKISTLSDIGGDDVQGLTRAVAKTGVGKNIITDALENRSQDAVKRVSDELSKNVSNVDTYFGNLEDIAKARQKVASPLYQEAFTANKAVSSPEIDRILETPAGKAALKSAATKMQNDGSLMGKPDAELGEQARVAGIKAEGGAAPALNLRSLDYVKRSLDDQIGAAQRAGENDNVRILSGLKSKFTGALDNADSTGAYAKARSVFSDNSRLLEAQQSGRDFSNMTPEQLRMAMKNMGPDQKEAFRIGVRENLQNTVNKTADGSDPAKRIFGNTQKRAQLMEIFDNPSNYKQFETRMNEEIQAASTKNKVLGGSRTDYNLAADDELGQMVTDVARKGVTRSVIDAAANKIWDTVQKRYLGINEENAKYIANALVNREAGIKALQDLIAKTPKGDITRRAATDAIETIEKSNPDIIRRGASTLQNAPNPKSKPVLINVKPRVESK